MHAVRMDVGEGWLSGLFGWNVLRFLFSFPGHWAPSVLG